MSKNQICAERLYLTADRDELVGEGSDRAAVLYASVGDEIPHSAAERFGLKDGKLPGKKSGKAPANKGGKGSADKGGKAPADKEQAPTDDKETAPADDKSQPEGTGK